MALKRYRLAQRRRAVGQTQEQLAERLSVERSTVGRWERGETDPSAYVRPRLARELRVTLLELDDLLVDVQTPAPPQVVVGPSDGFGASVAPWPTSDLAAMHAFRAADRRLGGGHMYTTVMTYLQVSIAPQIFGTRVGSDGAAVFTAAGALSEMAGWMAHDAGHDQMAGQHFRRSYDLAVMGGDRQLCAHILASMSHLALHLGRLAEAIELAERGQSALNNASPNHGVAARLMAMQARGLAATGEPGLCGKALLQAECALGRHPVEEVSPWVSQFDAGSLANESARCLRALGELDAARRQAEQIIALRSREQARSRAFGHLLLASVLIAQGRPDEACIVIQEALNATESLASFQVVQQLQQLREQLLPYRTVGAVARFLECLSEAVGERLSRYPRLAV
jgi:transcriptional regulator with XRE-family HTH domain